MAAERKRKVARVGVGGRCPGACFIGRESRWEPGGFGDGNGVGAMALATYTRGVRRRKEKEKGQLGWALGGLVRERKEEG